MTLSTPKTNWVFTLLGVQTVCPQICYSIRMYKNLVLFETNLQTHYKLTKTNYF